MTDQEIQKLVAEHTALLSEYAALKEDFALMQQQMSAKGQRPSRNVGCGKGGGFLQPNLP